MEQDNIMLKPWYNWKSSPEITNSRVSSRKDLLRESSRIETDLSNHHKREMHNSIDRDIKEESFGPYQNRSISIKTGNHNMLSPASEIRTSKNMEGHLDMNNNAFINNFSMKHKRSNKNKLSTPVNMIESTEFVPASEYHRVKEEFTTIRGSNRHGQMSAVRYHNDDDFK